MFGAFLFPFGHLLLYDAWIDSVASGFGFLLLHLPEQRVVPCLKGLRHPGFAFWQSAPGKILGGVISGDTIRNSLRSSKDTTSKREDE